MPKSKKVPTKNESEAREGHSIWKGYITFGLVNIPIIIYSADKRGEELHFKLLDKHDLSGIRYLRINEETGKEVPWSNIVKGYEYEAGKYAILTEKDFESVALENLKTIEIEDFVKFEELGMLYFEKPYYVLPDKQGAKGYALLREVLKETKKIGIARILLRSHQYLAAIVPYKEALIINTLRYPQELKTPSEMHIPDEPNAKTKISKKEFEIAKQLVNTMTVKWEPKHYSNEYRDKLMKLIKEKIASGNKGSIKRVKEPAIKKTNVIDFMDLLKKSVKQKQSISKPIKKGGVVKKRKS
jgi:DNA end-binding protein Ku